MGDGTKLGFNVNIKVEEIEEEDLEERITQTVVDKQQKTFYTKVISVDDSDDDIVRNENFASGTDSKCNQGDSSNEIQGSSSEIEYEINYPSDCDNEKKYYIIYKSKVYTLTRESILKGIEEQAKLLKNKSDIILNKFIRTYHPEYHTHTRTVHENLLDNALELWKNWYECNPKVRSTPVLYKCYICNKGWWRLDPFRQHIITHKHPRLSVSFEEVANESSIVASIGLSKKNKLVIVHSNCWKCNKPLKNNALTKVSAEKFTCESCQILLYTDDYIPKTERRSGLSCTICATYCSSEEILHRHMVLYHTPNSDEPAVTNTKICNLCEEKFFLATYHDCPKRSKLYKCHFCSNKYMTKKLAHFHMSMNKGFGTCPECSNKYKQCSLIEHMLHHSTNYDVLYYCCKCKNNLLHTSVSVFNKHMISHGNSVQRRRYKVQMLLPLKCIKGVIVDSVVPLEVPHQLIIKYINGLQYMNSSVPELIDIIKRQETIQIKEIELLAGTVIQKENEVTQLLTESMSKQNQSAHLKQSDIAKKVRETTMCGSIASNTDDDAIESDYESDNYAFQVQLDAEIERDIEIEKQISKVFKASNCYKNFLDKEANDPIDDMYNDEVCIIDRKDDVLVISDSDDDTETSKLIIDSICEEVPSTVVKQEIETDVEFEHDSNLSDEIVIEENNFNCVSVKIESCEVEEKTNNIFRSEELVNVRQIKQEESIIESKDNKYSGVTEKEEVYISNDGNCEIKKAKLDVIMNAVIDEGVERDFSNVKSECLKEEFCITNVECQVDFHDWTIEKPSSSKKRKIDNTATYSCIHCEYTGLYKQFIYHTMDCQNITCSYCKKTFGDINMYLSHLTEHKLRYLSCPQCFRNYNMSRYLRNHIASHIIDLFLKYSEQSDFRTYRCHVCDGLVDVQDFFIHWESHLELNEIALDAMSDSEAELKSEMTPELVEKALNILSDTRKNYKHKICIVCGKALTRRIDSKRHLIEHLLHESKIDMAVSGGHLPCPMCGMNIKEVSEWRQHMREHAHIRAYRCALCPKMFCDSSNYTKHKKVHNQYNFICDLCGGKFCAKSSIIRHLATHEKRTPLPCPQCPRSFDSEHRLRRHIRVKHKRYQMSCTVCKRKFDTCKQRWDHMWEKHKIRKFAADCPICKKQYRRFMDVKNHLRSEHGLQTVEKACNFVYKSKVK